MDTPLTDEELYDLSDEELERRFKEAKAAEGSPETDLEERESELPEPESADEVDEEEEFDEDVEEDEEADEDLEQSEEDSDDDASSDEDEEDESEEDSEETDEDDLDGDSEEDDAEATDDKEESDEDEQPVQKHKYRANGQEFEFTNDEIIEKFGQVFGQAMNYTQKMQQIKPWRKTIDAIEQANLSHDDLNLAIDVLKGDKDAIASLLKRTGVDALELEDAENSEYQPRDYGRNDTELDIKDIVDEISGDKEYAITYNVLEKQWDEGSRKSFVENPELIRQLHVDVKSGMFDVISPMANKIKVYDGGRQSDLDYYKAAAQQYFQDQAKEQERTTRAQEAEARKQELEVERERIAEVKAKEEKRKATKSASSKRKAAAPTKKSAGTKKVTDYLDDSDEAFDDWYSNLQDNL